MKKNLPPLPSVNSEAKKAARLELKSLRLNSAKKAAKARWEKKQANTNQ